MLGKEERAMVQMLEIRARFLGVPRPPPLPEDDEWPFGPVVANEEYGDRLQQAWLNLQAGGRNGQNRQP